MGSSNPNCKLVYRRIAEIAQDRDMATDGRSTGSRKRSREDLGPYRRKRPRMGRSARWSPSSEWGEGDSESEEEDKVQEYRRVHILQRDDSVLGPLGSPADLQTSSLVSK